MGFRNDGSKTGRLSLLGAGSGKPGAQRVPTSGARLAQRLLDRPTAPDGPLASGTGPSYDLLAPALVKLVRERSHPDRGSRSAVPLKR